MTYKQTKNIDQRASSGLLREIIELEEEKGLVFHYIDLDGNRIRKHLKCEYEEVDSQ